MKRITGLKSHLNIGELFADIGMPPEQESLENQLRWSDNYAYELSLDEIESLENRANELYQICLSVVESEINQGNYAEYHFSSMQKEMIERDWKNRKGFCYGYFDFCSDGINLGLKKCNFGSLQFLIESSLLQWKWIEMLENADNKEQYNWIHQAFINYLKYLKQEQSIFYLTDSPNFQVSYLKDLLELSDWKVLYTSIDKILTNHKINSSIISTSTAEWFQNQRVIASFLDSSIYPFEPSWNQLLSHPHFLKKLSEQYKSHSFFTSKCLSKEQTGNLPALSMWIVGNSACGLAIKEKVVEKGKVYTNVIPHYFVE